MGERQSLSTTLEEARAAYPILPTTGTGCSSIGVLVVMNKIESLVLAEYLGGMRYGSDTSGAEANEYERGSDKAVDKVWWLGKANITAKVKQEIYH